MYLFWSDDQSLPGFGSHAPQQSTGSLKATYCAAAVGIMCLSAVIFISSVQYEIFFSQKIRDW